MDRFLKDLPSNYNYLDFVKDENMGGFDEIIYENETKKEQNENLNKPIVNKPIVDNPAVNKPVVDNPVVGNNENTLEKQPGKDVDNKQSVNDNKKPIYNYTRDPVNGNIIIENTGSKLTSSEKPSTENNKIETHDRQNVLYELSNACNKEVTKLSIELEINEELLRLETSPIERKFITSRINSIKDSLLKNSKRKKVIDKFISDLLGGN